MNCDLSLGSLYLRLTVTSIKLCPGMLTSFSLQAARCLPAYFTVAMRLARHCTIGSQHRFTLLSGKGVADQCAVLVGVAESIYGGCEPRCDRLRLRSSTKNSGTEDKQFMVDVDV